MVFPKAEIKINAQLFFEQVALMCFSTMILAQEAAFKASLDKIKEMCG